MPKKILLIFIAGLLLRLVYVLYVPQYEVNSDATAYTTLARNVAAGNGYVDINGKADIRWPPGYPIFISVVYKIFGVENNTAVRIVQSMLTSLLILIVYIIARKIFNLKTAFIASTFTSFYPAFIFYSGFLSPQTLAAFLLPLFIFSVVFFKWNILSFLWLGILGGYASLVRPELPLCFLIMFAIMFFKDKPKGRIFKYVFTAFISMCLVISAWTLRNYRVFHRIVPISTHLGSTAWESTWEGDWQDWQSAQEAVKPILKGRDLTEADRDLLKAGINNLKQHPFIYLKLCAKRLFRLWAEGHSYVCRFLAGSTASYFKQGNYSLFAIKLFLLIFNVSIVILGFFGIRIAYKKFDKKRGYIRYAVIPIWYYVIFFCFTFCTGRYSVPVLPIMIIFAAGAIGCVFDRAEEKNAR